MRRISVRLFAVNATLLVLTAAECAGQFEVTPLSRVAGAAAGTTIFSVNSGVGWSVEDDANWLTATKTNGSTISASYDENTSTNSRTANIRAYGTGGVEQIVTVTQRSPLMIGDFEGALDAGWEVVGGANWEITTDWSSSGLHSLKITPQFGGFHWPLEFNDVAVIRKLSSTHYLAFDVHWATDEWLPESGGDAWTLWDVGAINTDVRGWGQLNDRSTQILDPANPSFPGNWDPINWGGPGTTHQRTLTYNFTGLGYNATGAGWGQFFLSVNSGQAETLGSFYIDNVRLEPVTAGVGMRVHGFKAVPEAGGVEVTLQVQATGGRLPANMISVEHATHPSGPWNEIGTIYGDGTNYAGVLMAPEGRTGSFRAAGP